MHVVATAGHVDHGKSTLVRALTGMEPDRWAEERRRGMTIDLGFAWTTLADGEVLAFVDVPGHERFVPNMLAGVGPVPAALIVVAADEGWMPQSAEHLAALDALGVRHGLVVVTRCDLADPGPAAEGAVREVASTTLGDVPAVAVSSVTGDGLDSLRSALARLVARLPAPESRGSLRLWLDRSFTVRGAGTVVTGTLGAGQIAVGDELELFPSRRRVRVRGLQTLGHPVSSVSAVARVAVNLRGLERHDVGRGDVLLTPGDFLDVAELDVRLRGPAAAEAVGERLMLHVGSAAVPARVRPLGDDAARLRLDRPLPLRIGDVALLRDPGRHRIVAGADVLDVRPPVLRRRGAARLRAAELATMTGRPDVAEEVRRRRLVRRDELSAMGVPDGEACGGGVRSVGQGWLVAEEHWAQLRRRLEQEVERHRAEHPLEPGAPVDLLRRTLGLPDRRLVDSLVGGESGETAALVVVDGRIRKADAAGAVPPRLLAALGPLQDRLRSEPFGAPEAGDLAAWGLGAREIATAVRAGLVLKVADGVVLLAGSDERAVRVLATLAQPFTLSEARQALRTTRRVAVPLLELLDRRGLTERLPDDRRRVRATASG